MIFESHGRKYAVDQFGVINQIDVKPFTYDKDYVATYDTPEYKRQSEILQALRLGFVIAAHGQNPTSILDWGYGNGAFMKFAKQHVEKIFGNDVTGILVEGCDIINSPGVISPGCFDVVTFWDVFEHIPDLSFIEHLLCDTVVMSLPNCHYFTKGKQWFDEKYKHRKPDEHLHHFNAMSLENTMRHYGWKVIAIATFEDIIRKSTHGSSNILSMAFKRY